MSRVRTGLIAACIAGAAVVAGVGVADAQTTSPSPSQSPPTTEAPQNGARDHFCDKDGDGVDDRTGESTTPSASTAAI